MRRSDLGFVLLTIVLLATLGWWWTERYAAEKAVLGDRLDVRLADWRTSRIKSSLKQVFIDSISVTSSSNIIDVAPSLKIDIKHQRVIRLDTESDTQLAPSDTDGLKINRLSEILAGGFAMGASAAEVDSVLKAIAEPLGARLRLVQTDFPAPLAPDTLGRFFRTVTKEAKVIQDATSLETSADELSILPDYIFVEDYRRRLFERILPEIAMGTLLLLGLFAFYGLMRRDLRRREAALIEKDRFIANIAHELKTPIAVVGIALESLENFGADADPERRLRYLKTSREELGRLEVLAERALGTILLEAATPPVLSRESVDLLAFAETSWGTLSLKHVLPSNLSTSVKTSSDATVLGDPLLLRHLLDNLLENAIKYGGNADTIRLAVSSTPSMVSFVITDDGPGIPFEERERVFEKFYRVQTEGEGHRVKGHGLGLSYAAQIVRRHGGTISIASGPEDRGTAVTVNLPRQ
ncbi:MAG: sensor histidine kinase [Saprospiraceae bacterium]